MHLPSTWLFELALALISAGATFGAALAAVTLTLRRDRQRLGEEFDRQRELRRADRKIEAIDGLLGGVVQASAEFSQTFGEPAVADSDPLWVARRSVTVLDDARFRFGHRVGEENWEVTERIYALVVMLRGSEAAAVQENMQVAREGLGMAKVQLLDLRVLLESLAAGTPRPAMLGDPPPRDITLPR